MFEIIGYLVRIKLLCLVLAVLFARTAHGNYSAVVFNNTLNGKVYSTAVEYEEVKKTPVFDFESGECPPLSFAEAAAIASAELLRLVDRPTLENWSFDRIELNRSDNLGHWLYSVSFQRMISANEPNGPSVEYFTVLVLMDGTVVKAVPEDEESPR